MTKEAETPENLRNSVLVKTDCPEISGYRNNKIDSLYQKKRMKITAVIKMLFD